MFATASPGTKFGGEYGFLRVICNYENTPRWDGSLLETMRAVLHSRRDGMRFGVQEYSDVYSGGVPTLDADEWSGKILCDNFNTQYSFYIANSLTASEEDFIKFCETGTKSPKYGWVYVGKIRAFFAKHMPVYCFVNMEQNTTVVFTYRLDIARYHHLQTAILAMMPYIFDKEKGITEDENALFEALQHTNVNKYVEVMNRIYDSCGFYEKMLTDALNGFEARKYDEQIQTMDNQINADRRNIRELEERIGGYYNRISVNMAQLAGLRQERENNTGSELLDYFKRSKSVKVIQTDEDSIQYTVSAYLDYYDEEEAEHCINNDDSYIYRAPSQRYVSKNEMRQLMRAIFIDRVMRIRFVGVYRLKSGSVTGISGKRLSAEYKDRMQNPHIYYHACLGNYNDQIRNAMRNADYIAAIESTIASAGSLNFGDSTVLSEFMKDMYSTTERFIELEDGRIVNPPEAVAYLNESGYIKTEKEEDEDGTAD